jgi:fibro-slime domain-containing protein
MREPLRPFIPHAASESGQAKPERAARQRTQGMRAGLGLGLLAVAVLASNACSPGREGGQQVNVIRPGASATDSLLPGATEAPSVLAPTASDLALVDAPAAPSCGDGTLDPNEQCDDGNTTAGDGCSANCLVVEQGYTCPTPGAACAPAVICGDGRQNGGEQCDDGNATGGDGCSATCQLERDFACPTPGKKCVSSVSCGDGRVSGAEECDDGNAIAGDGCSADCKREAGFTCLSPGAHCLAICGDGFVLGAEQCDDGKTNSGDCCSATCGDEPGFACLTPGQACVRTVCGDGKAQGSEGCDDGNDRPFDGCFQCVKEPVCVRGECDAVCGDGLRYDSEECDDGNTQNGDGCDENCKLEPGFACADQGGTGATANSFVLPVIYRDFIGADTSGDGLAAQRVTARAAASVTQDPDFNTFQGTGEPGAVQNQLGADGLPVFACASAATPGCAAVLTNFTSAARFDQWYRDTAGVNLPVVSQLTLQSIGGGAFLFDSATDSVNGQFDPLLDQGFQDPALAENGVVLEGHEFCIVDKVPVPDAPTGTDAAGNKPTPRNMSFTTETRFVFEYVGGERFEFSGDDDVWVFVNNRLIVDLGGLHEVSTGEFTLDDQGLATVTRAGPVQPAGSTLTSLLDTPVAPNPIDTQMVLGNVYEAVLFHAERHECGSNFKLTLAGFDKARSVCREVCGDGLVTRSESCDDGAANGSGYGACAADCTPGPRCGDGLVNGDAAHAEACDNGLNIDRYSTSADACGPGCTLPSFCGDGVVDAEFGEACDDGKNDDSYGGCSPNCQLGPRCGDGDVNGPDEDCDDGNRINGDGCNLDCHIERPVTPS